jgi:hypothetical protein
MPLKIHQTVLTDEKPFLLDEEISRKDEEVSREVAKLAAKLTLLCVFATLHEPHPQQRKRTCVSSAQ